MKKYKNYGGLKYLIQDGKNPVFKFICYEEEKKTKTKKRKKMIRKTRRCRRRRKSTTK